MVVTRTTLYYTSSKARSRGLTSQGEGKDDSGLQSFDKLFYLMIMAAKTFDFKGNYCGLFEEGKLQWRFEPEKSEYDSHGQGLRIWPKKDTDFWQRTYYNPSIIKDDGHFLYRPVGDKIFMETFFSLTALHQFDQAGLMVHKDEHHWIKAGLEFSDGAYTLGVVVTNNFSDWSTTKSLNGNVGIRIYRQGNSFVVEAKQDTSEHWEMIRLCHLDVDETEDLPMGIFTCSPKNQGGHTLFKNLKYEPFIKYHHNAE